jgi:hypothetical protein
MIISRIFRPSSCSGLATSIALFIGSGEGNPHDLLLANPLQSSSSTFSRGNLLSFFAFKESTCPVYLPGAPHTLTTHDLIRINSYDYSLV